MELRFTVEDTKVYGRSGRKLRQDRTTAGRLPYGEEASFSLFGCVQDGTGLGYTAVGAGLRSPGHAGVMQILLRLPFESGLERAPN